MRVLVAGAGMGGLTAALSMSAAGMRDFGLVEEVKQIYPLGVGINLLPHAVRELDELGLTEELAAAGLEVERTVYYDRHGNRIAALPRGRAAGYAWPQYSMHRGSLQMLLLRRVLDTLGPEAVRTGTAVQGFETRDGHVRVELESGADRDTEEHGVLVGADGVRSVVRQALYPDEGGPCWNECVMYRGTTRMDHEFLEQRTVLFAGHHDQRFMLYPIREPDGEMILNWGCTLKVDGPLLEHSNWNRGVDPTIFRDRYADWVFDGISVADVIDSADAVFEYPMVDRDPLSRWSFGRTTLLGDAAHPMYPSGSNGTSQAILDARVLAKELATAGNDVVALQRYQAARLETTAQTVLSNRQMADMRLLQLVHERAPMGFTNVEDVISAEEIAQVQRSYQRTAGFDPRLLSERPSLSVS